MADAGGLATGGRWGAIALVAGALLAGCGEGEEAKVIDWDFRESATVPEEDLSRPDHSANEITPVESVRIRLPEGKTFEADGGIGRIAVDRDLGNLERLFAIQVMSEPQTADDAYELALEWAELFALPREPLEEWRRKEEPTATALSADPDAKLGPGGPTPAVKILNSFEDDRPSIAALELAWPEEN